MPPATEALLSSVDPGEVIGATVRRRAVVFSKARLNHESYTLAAKTYHNVDSGAEASENSSVPFSAKSTH
jgi:hypothetical protein